MVRRSAVLSGLLLSGCLLTTNLDGLSGAGPSTTPPQAEAGPEGDASTTLDGDRSDAPEASSTVDSGPACAHLFCCNFDGADDVTQGWSDTELTGPGTVTLEKTIVTSAPHAFAATMPPMSGYDAALLTKFFSKTPGEVHLDMRVYLDQLDVSTNEISVGVVGQENMGGSAFSRVRIFVADGQAILAEDYTDVSLAKQTHRVANAYAWPLQKWTTLHVDITPTTASLRINGTTYATLAKVGMWTQPVLALKIGVYYSLGQMGGQRIVYDDVVLDAK